MVLVMESAATSRSLRRFLLVPEGRQSRRGRQVGGRGEGRAEREARSARPLDPAPSTGGTRGRSSPTGPRAHQQLRSPRARSPPSPSRPGGQDPVNSELLATIHRAEFQNECRTQTHLSHRQDGLSPHLLPPALLSAPQEDSLATPSSPHCTTLAAGSLGSGDILTPNEPSARSSARDFGNYSAPFLRRKPSPKGEALRRCKAWRPPVGDSPRRRKSQHLTY